MKRLFFGIIFMLLMMAPSDTPQARVTGVCSNCHTMHNSQAGDEMAQELTSDPWGWADDTTPNPSLLIYSCVGCHTRVQSSTTIDDGVPVVFNTQSPTNPLAGGNFYYVTQGQANGHNVTGITGSDTNFSGDNIPGSTTSYSGNQVTCAGEKGCHGDRTAGNDELEGIKEAHHTDDTGGITGASVGLSYRFLNGILGTEDSDWEQDNTITSHNEYQGSTSSATNTISYLCANCHGNFHTWQGGATEVGTASPWLRHPTDLALPSTGEYQYYNGGTGGTAAADYSMTAPLARPNLGSVSDTSKINPGTDIVMCLSCHRAHGSNCKLIRWNYKSTTLSTALSGCGVCHTTKK